MKNKKPTTVAGISAADIIRKINGLITDGYILVEPFCELAESLGWDADINQNDLDGRDYLFLEFTFDEQYYFCVFGVLGHEFRGNQRVLVNNDEGLDGDTFADFLADFAERNTLVAFLEYTERTVPAVGEMPIEYAAEFIANPDVQRVCVGREKIGRGRKRTAAVISGYYDMRARQGIYLVTTAREDGTETARAWWNYNEALTAYKQTVGETANGKLR